MIVDPVVGHLRRLGLAPGRALVLERVFVLEQSSGSVVAVVEQLGRRGERMVFADSRRCVQPLVLVLRLRRVVEEFHSSCSLGCTWRGCCCFAFVAGGVVAVSRR